MDGLIIKEKWLRLILSDRIQRRNDAADGLRAAVITAYESGVLK